MELWIRSQDKEKLLKVNDIAIEMNMIYGYFDKNTEYEHLGSYATKERALEILDEIQNILKPPIIFQEHEGVITTNDNIMHIINPTYGEIKQLETIIYEMPKE